MEKRLGSLRQWIKQHPYATVMEVLCILFLFVLFAYSSGWDWTGFNSGTSQITITSTSKGNYTATISQPPKLLWDWLQLLGVLAVPVVVGLGAAWFTAQQGKVSDRENKDNQREAQLQSYIDKMSELLLNEHLGERTADDNLKPEREQVQKIARVRTITVLTQLDARRVGYVFAFLREAVLQSTQSDRNIISFNNANLSKINLSQASLPEANLSGANLSGANLSGADLSGANLSGADLSGADLSGTNLTEANLTEVNLTEANLRKANLRKATLDKAIFSYADLSGANLSGAWTRLVPQISSASPSANFQAANFAYAILSNANFIQADLRYANFNSAHLNNTDLSGANLSEANLLEGDCIRLRNGRTIVGGVVGNKPADLSGANLYCANLSRARIEHEQWEKAKTLEGATMPDGSKRPSTGEYYSSLLKGATMPNDTEHP